MGKLPNVKLSYDNGALGQAISSADGLLCIAVVGAVSVNDVDAGKYFFLNNLYRIRSLKDLEDMGCSEETGANWTLYTIVRDFYKEAQEGTPVYIIGYPATLPLADITDKQNPYLTKVIEETKGEIRGFILSGDLESDCDNNGGMHMDAFQAIFSAQSLGEWAAEVKHAPIFTIIDAVKCEEISDNYEDFRYFDNNRVGVFIGSQSEKDINQSVGLLAGRIASIPVHRSIARVKDGAIKANSMYIAGYPAEGFDVEYLHGLGIISVRTFTGFAGYYFTDDVLATRETDDYCYLSRRRVVDKAYRIAYPTLLEELSDEIPVNADGTMLETYAAAFEQKVINAIATNMTANGELSADPGDANDQGVQFTIDRTTNILATNEVKATLRVRPHGYAKYINVLLGFTLTQNN